MNENIDLAKILEGCPDGTEFYSSVFGNVRFVKITVFNAILTLATTTYQSFGKDGRLCYGVGECTLFPSKDQRDWSKFERFWDKPKAEEPMAEMFDENTLKPFDKVLVRNFIFDCWNAVTFSHINFKRQAVCCGISWEQCVPYNEKTKYLVNTNEDCPEYYKWWTV